jgi:hypothetical protein
MGGKDEQIDAICNAKFPKFHGNMTAMAVEDEESPTSSSFLICDPIEDLFEPAKAELIV